MTAKGMLDRLDAAAARWHLRLQGEQPGLSIFLVHGIFEDDAAVRRNLLFPQEHMTRALFRQFLDHFTGLGYQFLHPAQIVDEALDPRGQYALLTFDDGYFNNTWVLDLLSEYQVPALIFISTAYVQEQRGFWSDVLYREAKRRGAGDAQILKEIMRLKSQKVAAIFDELTTSFGAESLQPRGDADRPLTLAELEQTANHPFVHIGNHTHWHEVLTNLSNDEMRAEIAQSQQLLERHAGYKPQWISYPNGSVNREVVCVCKDAGFRAGITVVQQKNAISQAKAGGDAPFLLSRFNPVARDGKIDYDRLRSSFQLKTRVKQWLQ